MTYHLAIDIGASSGRHILGWVEDGRMQLKEVYRFENRLVEKNGHLCWEMDRLWDNVVAGLKACKDAGFVPATVGIDTWAVDFVLLDGAGQVIGDTVAYRDGRTEGERDRLAPVLPLPSTMPAPASSTRPSTPPISSPPSSGSIPTSWPRPRPS